LTLFTKFVAKAGFRRDLRVFMLFKKQLMIFMGIFKPVLFYAFFSSSEFFFSSSFSKLQEIASVSA
jgi:hypothetical protein